MATKQDHLKAAEEFFNPYKENPYDLRRLYYYSCARISDITLQDMGNQGFRLVCVSMYALTTEYYFERKRI